MKIRKRINLPEWIWLVYMALILAVAFSVILMFEPSEEEIKNAKEDFLTVLKSKNIERILINKRGISNDGYDKYIDGTVTIKKIILSSKTLIKKTSYTPRYRNRYYITLIKKDNKTYTYIFQKDYFGAKSPKKYRYYKLEDGSIVENPYKDPSMIVLVKNPWNQYLKYPNEYISFYSIDLIPVLSEVDEKISNIEKIE